MTAMVFRALRPALFALDAETAHRATIQAVQFLPRRATDFDQRLASSVAGLAFPSPVGLAAGFDKDGIATESMLGLGFGFVEVGTLTPRAQAGNPRPRLFRLVEDRAVINRMGFNNGGQAAAHARLARRDRRRGIVGVNIGANKDAADRVADYVEGVAMMGDVADYLAVNISSPNTPGLRGLQDAGALDALLAAIGSVRAPGGPPVFLKVAPDLDHGAVDAITRLATGRVDALIVGNTTVSRPPLASRHGHEAGGLSGAPLRTLATETLAAFRSATGGTVPLVAVGGIDSAEEAWARIVAGASLVQLYTALVYEGPGLVRQITDGIAARLARDGFNSLGEAVGSATARARPA